MKIICCPKCDHLHEVSDEKFAKAQGRTLICAGCREQFVVEQEDPLPPADPFPMLAPPPPLPPKPVDIPPPEPEPAAAFQVPEMTRAYSYLSSAIPAVRQGDMSFEKQRLIAVLVNLFALSPFGYLVQGRVHVFFCVLGMYLIAFLMGFLVCGATWMLIPIIWIGTVVDVAVWKGD